MWHEARKQEKKIRGMIVDYRKRADRRKEFYERIRADPTQFLQLHGRKCKINFEVSDLTDDSHMMKWQGQSDNLIDRFDVRAHLDHIPSVKATKEEGEVESTLEERLTNYERYRILAQNEFLGVTEESFLKQLQLEEQFGVNAHQIENDKSKKKNSQATAAIGYNYDDSTTTTVPFSQTIMNIESASTSNRFEEFSKDFSDDSDVDMDVAIDINKIGTTEAHELNNCGKRYGMQTNDFFSYLTKDEDEKQSMKAIKEQEADKVLGGGRKSRRERRSQRERRILGKPLSPPSYAAKEEKPKILEESEDDDDKSSRNNSRSPSPEKITYITSFGGEEELKPHAKISITLNKPTLRTPGSSRVNTSSYADKVKQNLDKLKKINDDERDKSFRRRSRSVSDRRRKSSRSQSRHRRDSSRSRSTSRRRRYSSRSTSGSRRRNYSSRSRSTSRSRRRSSRSYSRSSYSSDSRDRSRKRRMSPIRKQSFRKRSLSRKRSYSRDTLASRKRSLSRKRSYTPKKSRSKSRKRSYSSSSSSSSTSSSSSSVRLPTKKLSRSKTVSRAKSPRPKTKSLSREKTSSTQTPIASSSEIAPIKRYYGRRKDDESSSSLSVDSGSDGDDKKNVSNQSSANDAAKVKSYSRSSEFKVGVSKSTVGGPTVSNPREKLKKKMQLLLNKQYKADKKAETERIERQMQQQQERDEEMRELALKLRRKQRELRHRYGDARDSKSESESDANGGESSRKKRSSSSSSSSTSSSSSSGSRNKANRQRKAPLSITRSPVKYSRRSRSRSTGRNYSRRYTRSRSRDYRR